MKKIIGITLILTLFFIFTSVTPCVADPEMKVGVFGASIIGGFHRVGGLIYNDGTYPIYNVNYTFTITGGNDDSIDLSLSKTLDSLSHNEAHQITTNEVYGFGPIIITMRVTSLNAGDTTVSVNGFQLGPYTLSQPWILVWYII